MASPADSDTPLTMAKVTGAELLRALRTEADWLSGIANRLREAIETVTDPTAAEAEVEAVRAVAEQRAAQHQWRAEADAAAEEMTAQTAAAEARADKALAACAAAEADRDTAVQVARQDAATRIGAAETERDTAIAQARAEADQRASAAEADRDQAITRAADAEQAAR
jgi:colicin import membrane protein